MDLHNETIESLQQKLSEGETTSVELTEQCLSRVEEDDTNAFVSIYDDAIEQAKVADKHLSGQEGGSLCGIPLAIKDNILFKDKPASAGSKILEDYNAPYSATAVKRLKEAGAVLIGRTNMDEFAMGSSTEHSAYGPTRNPHDTDRVPGGSSGGSAAAVAGDLIPAALGSDTGGSVRQPASLCGAVGLKPTYGAVSRYGLMAMGSSLDQIGPITKNVSDAQTIFECIAGNDPKDSTTISSDTYSDPVDEPKTIGIPENLLKKDGIDSAITDNFDEAVDTLEGAGFETTGVSLDVLSHALSIYYIIMPAEVSSNLARFDGVKFGLRTEDDDLFRQYVHTRRDGFGAEVKRRILLGTYVLSAGYYDAYYRTAVQARKALKGALDEVFEEVDAIVTPTTPAPAFLIGEKSDDPLEMYLQDIFTVSANIAGIPALSVPSGTTTVDGTDLPLGLQIMAPHGHESSLFSVGRSFETAQS